MQLEFEHRQHSFAQRKLIPIQKITVSNGFTLNWFSTVMSGNRFRNPPRSLMNP